MDLLGFGIIIPLLPLYAKDYHASAIEVGLLFSIYSGCQFLASPILGVISDRFGRRPVLVFSQLGSVIGYLLLGVVMTFHWDHPAYALASIYVSRIIDVGLSGGKYLHRAGLHQRCHDARHAGQRDGSARRSLRRRIRHGAGDCVPAGRISSRPSRICRRADERRRDDHDLFASPRESGSQTRRLGADWLHPRKFAPVFRQSRLVQLLAIAFISMAAFSMLESMMALFLSDKSTFTFSPRGVGLYYTYLGVIIVIVQGGLIGRLTKRLGEWPLSIAGALFVAAGMWMLAEVAISPLMWMLMLGGAVNAVGRSLQTPTLYALISHNGDPKEQGLVFGLNQGLSSIARILGPAAAAAIFTGGVGRPFILGGAIMVIAFIWTAGLRAAASKTREISALPARYRRCSENLCESDFEPSIL